MERRRFVPGSENLEVRQLLSGAGQALPVAAQVQTLAAQAGAPDTDAPLPAGVVRAAARTAAQARNEANTTRERPLVSPADANTSPLRNLRIDRLPNLLHSVRPDRPLPPELITALQDDLRAIEGTLTRASSSALFLFNTSLRSTLSRASARVEDAATLNWLFGRILEDAGGNPSVVARFQENMKTLAQIDSGQNNPAQLMANDYSVMLQSALAIGQDFGNLAQGPRQTTAFQNSALGTGTAFNR